MSIASAIIGNQRLLHLIGGFAVGAFVGLKVLPVWFAVAPPDEAQLQALRTQAAELEPRIEQVLLGLDHVERAEARLLLSLDHRLRRQGEVAITVRLTSEPTPDQIEGMTTLVTSVAGLRPGDVVFVDGGGRHLNKDALMQLEQKQFWTGIAINIAKILGILAALITMRFVIRAVGKGECA